MSGPFRFNQEEARSPLDRSASPFSAGQPVSFKTNVNRMKTKKWVQAKKNAYDGDDWGDYDEYDEYGVNQEPARQPRSFTDPSQQAPLSKARRNSFEQGEEQRAFSSSIPPPQQGYAPQYGDPRPQASGAGYDADHDADQRREFSPSAVPPPLQTRISQVPSDINASPANTQFPPRKSSIGQGESSMVTSARARTGSQTDKPLPFVPSADISQRPEEERGRGRASLDSDSLSSPQMESGKSLSPLDTVAERKSEHLPNFDPAFPQNGEHNHASPPDDQGFRSVVDQAFVRNDDERSIPPTPISSDSNSEMSRTNTGSTYGISPIMSRVPSSATSALKNRNQAGGEGSTPAIAEEPSETTTPGSRPTTAFISEGAPHESQKPSLSHSRNFSGSSLPRSGFATPTRGDSPARSSVIAMQKDLPEPETAQFATENLEAPEAMEGGLQGPSSAYAAREADMATAMKSSPVGAAPELTAAARHSQNMFLESHNAQSPIEDALPRDRSESPSKGRVQALAGRFGDVSHSRRGSTQSNRSRNSVQSWENSQNNSRAASPTKASPSKPSSPIKEFRPHLPGQWESYATTAMTPSDQSEGENQLNVGKDKISPLEQVDLTPTTARRPVAEAEAESSDPMAALKDAGAAMVQSIRATVGLDGTSSVPQQDQKSNANHGDVYLPRPLQLGSTASLVSSVPPTPPVKNSPEKEYPLPLHLKGKASGPFTGQQRPSLDPQLTQLSTDTSTEDQESDRLRKEIVASLNPVKTSEGSAHTPDRTSLQPVSPGTNRASSILPSEYDTYWADEDRLSPQHSQDEERTVPAPSVAVVPTTKTQESPDPSLPKRFSWDADSSQSQTPQGSAQAVSNTEPVKLPQEEGVSPPTIDRAAEEERQQWSEGLPDSYFGPSHTLTVTKPEPITDPTLGERSPTPPLNSALAPVSPTREQTRSPGLHVVNTEINPEAVDLPPRFSAEIRQAPRFSPEENKTPQLEAGPEAPPKEIVSPIEEPKPSIVQDPAADSPTTDKPLGTREIATISSTTERIATYNKTRDQWATSDHGLDHWLASTLEANPELATQTFPVEGPRTASVRHRHTGSLALLGKFGGSSNHEHSAEQHNTAGAQVPTVAHSPTSGKSPGPGFGGRVAGQQMQLKGKDLLHTANVLSGKGMTSAKGLFAKGKSRFGRDKASSHPRTDSAPSSRDASEEPEMVMTRSGSSPVVTSTPEKPLTGISTESDNPNQEKKKRRFSISAPFLRSRSRPNSIALPSNPPSMFSTPRGTPSGELPRVLSGEVGPPQSYHAPDSWDSAPGVLSPVSTDQFQTTPPRHELQPQSRLGILPSPAKSAFSSEDQDLEHDVPPVPPIPDGFAERYHVRISQDAASHQMLQSVIRYATPPVAAKDIRGLAGSPVFADVDTEAGAEETSTDAGKALPHAPEQLQRQPETQLAEVIPEGFWQPKIQFTSGNEVPRQSNQHGEVGATRILYEPLPISPTFAHEVLGQTDNENEEALKAFSPAVHDDIDDDRPPQLNHDPLPTGIDAVPRVLAPADDDDDLPPQLNHDLLLIVTQSLDISPAISSMGSSQTNINEETGDDTKHTQPDRTYLQTPKAVHTAADVSPLLAPSQLPLDDIPGVDDGLWTPTHNELSHETNIVSVGDTAFTLVRRASDEDVTSQRLDEDDEKTSRSPKKARSASILVESANAQLETQPTSGTNMCESGDTSPGLSQTRPGDTALEAPKRDSWSASHMQKTVHDQDDFKRTMDYGCEEKRPAFETEVIGAGDVSPVSTSSYGVDDVDAIPRVARTSAGHMVWYAKTDLQHPKVKESRSESLQERSRASSNVVSSEQYTDVNNALESKPGQIGEIAASGHELKATRLGSLSPERKPPPGQLAPDANPNQIQRVSAMPFQVAHAVEEYAASNSSLASWDHESIAAQSPPETSKPDEMKDESDLVTPVAQVPRIIQNGPRAAKAEELHDDEANTSRPNEYFRGHTSFPGPMHQPHPSNSNMTVPERSKSILSQISAMVEEGGTPISPASSNTGRSTPSTIHRMQREPPTKTSLTPVQIPEEATTAWNDRTPTGKDDDFDLYADHNGIVKDMQDESGQPLRVTSAHAPDSAQHSQPIEPAVPTIGALPESEDEERPRYSTERPMSFTSGPTDEHGKPQDQINSSAPLSDQVPPMSEQHRQQPQQTHMSPIGMAYSSTPPTSFLQPPNHAELQHQPPPAHSSPARLLPPDTESQTTEPVKHNNTETQAPVTSPPLPPQGPALVPDISERQVVNGFEPQIGQIPYHNPQDPRIYDWPSGQPPSQGHPQAPGQLRDPRNQYEFHQQAMRLQAQNRRLQGAESQPPTVPAQSPNNQRPIPQEKQPSKPKLSSVFKGLGGRAHQQHSSTPNAGINSSLKPLPADPDRNGSFHSAVSSLSLSRETPMGRPAGQPGPYIPSNRPPNLGAQPNPSNANQSSTAVQPRNSRLDPAPFHNIPQQQPSTTAPAPSGQPQPYRGPTSGVPETGKKKRFSSLGALFNRASTGGDGLPTKFKTTKEEKKAQKAQRHSSPPVHASVPQRPPQQQQFRPQQPGLAYYPPGQFPPHTVAAVQPMDPRFASPQTMSPMPPQGAQSLPQRLAPQYQQPQQRLPSQPPMPGFRPEPGSAYQRTKRLAEEHQTHGSRHGTHAPSTSSDHTPSQLRQTSQGPPPGGYYEPDTKTSIADQGAYAASLAARQQAEQREQQEMLRQEGAYGALQAGRLQAQPQTQQLISEQGVYRDPRQEKQQIQQHQQHPMFKGPYGASQKVPQQIQQQRSQPTSEQAAYEESLAQHQRAQWASQQPMPTYAGYGASQDERLQTHQQQQRFYPEQQSSNVQSVLHHRSVSVPVPDQAPYVNSAVSQRHVSSPLTEPRYEAPPIPAAYNHVSGAFVSPHEQHQQAYFSPGDEPVTGPSSGQFGRQYSDPRMQPISPQISAQSQMPSGGRTHSDASTVSVVSPISQSPNIPTASAPHNQRAQRQRMSSISEVGQVERPWHLNFPEGATEQEIVRARQRQYMEQQFTTQQQQYAERTGQSPSPRALTHGQSPATTPTAASQAQVQGGGFRELLPRSSPQPYSMAQPTQQEPQRASHSPHPVQPAPIHPGQALQPAAYPLPMSPNSANTASPVNPLASAFPPPPPPKVPHSPMGPLLPISQSPPVGEQRRVPSERQQYGTLTPSRQQYSTPPANEPQYEQRLPDEPPPSYDGPSVPNDGMNKSRREHARPPNITTDPQQRQSSIGILQHPQPASMAASPQRTTADMGAESLRRQLLQQEESARIDRAQRTPIQRVESDHERKEREAARARARELERSASGGGYVSSLRSVGGSRSGGTPGWERRGSTTRPVFELPAVEDDEPTMKATSYPGQEWVPPMWTDD